MPTSPIATAADFGTSGSKVERGRGGSVTDERVKPTPLWHHLLYIGAILGMVALIGVFFTRVPMRCEIGYRLITTGQSQVCVKNGAGD